MLFFLRNFEDNFVKPLKLQGTERGSNKPVLSNPPGSPKQTDLWSIKESHAGTRSWNLCHILYLSESFVCFWRAMGSSSSVEEHYIDHPSYHATPLAHAADAANAGLPHTRSAAPSGGARGCRSRCWSGCEVVGNGHYERFLFVPRVTSSSMVVAIYWLRELFMSLVKQLLKILGYITNCLATCSSACKKYVQSSITSRGRKLTWSNMYIHVYVFCYSIIHLS